MKIAAVILSRYDSSRLPGKALLKIAGRPIIQYVIELCKSINNISDVVLATTNRKIDDNLVKFAESQKHQLNQDRVLAPIAVTKTFMIDNDKDPFYDKVTKVKYYNMGDKKYAFRAEGNSLNMSYIVDEEEVNIGKAIRSQRNNYYVISSKEMNGVGYFTKENDFVLEYYDQESDDTKIVVFEDLKF